MKKELKEDELENEDREDEDMLIYTNDDGKCGLWCFVFYIFQKELPLVIQAFP